LLSFYDMFVDGGESASATAAVRNVKLRG